MIGWLRQHRQAFVLAVRKLRMQGPAALLNAIVLGIALALPAGGYAVFVDLQALAERVAQAPQISAFFRGSVPRADAEALAERLKRDARIGEVRFVSREAALADLRNTEALAEIAAALGENPLPDALIVNPAQADPVAVARLTQDLRALPAISEVHVDSDWGRRFGALARIARIGIGLLAALLALGLIAVTFNTIRLQVLTQRQEIEVSRLIGATDAFIRRPFYYMGLLEGFAGGGLALGIVAASLAALNAGVLELSKTYGSTFQLQTLGWADGTAVVAFSGLLGWLGAYLSVSRYLREIDII